MLEYVTYNNNQGLIPAPCFRSPTREAEFPPRPMFVGNVAPSCEDNILTLINELFTGQLPPIKSGAFSFLTCENERCAHERPRCFEPLLRNVVAKTLMLRRRQTKCGTLLWQSSVNGALRPLARRSPQVPDPDRVLDGADENLAVADLAGLGRLDDCVHRRRHLAVP